MRIYHPPTLSLPRQTLCPRTLLYPNKAARILSISLKGVAEAPFTARVFPIPYFAFKGNLVDSQLRASNDINDPSTLARYLFRDGG